MKKVFEKCDMCGKEIKYGNAMVSVNMNIEQIDKSDEHPDGIISVIQSEQLITTCAECGNKLSNKKLRKVLKTFIKEI